ncbi:hypothetical protein [Euzebya sp.]|uniref:hypothetical protein n=1 Tax=Euzebya sp. TaxID=1971409 RepID=UPI003512EF94
MTAAQAAELGLVRSVIAYLVYAALMAVFAWLFAIPTGSRGREQAVAARTSG